jgi:hypothetical protein
LSAETLQKLFSNMRDYFRMDKPFNNCNP